jgi:hypothetical protein
MCSRTIVQEICISILIEMLQLIIKAILFAISITTSLNLSKLLLINILIFNLLIKYISRIIFVIASLLFFISQKYNFVIAYLFVKYFLLSILQIVINNIILQIEIFNI